jgi:4-hydroxybenzoate polyprenyltransferase
MLVPAVVIGGIYVAPWIANAVVAGTGIIVGGYAGWHIGNAINESADEEQDNDQEDEQKKRDPRGSKPDNCPAGTIPIDNAKAKLGLSNTLLRNPTPRNIL